MAFKMKGWNSPVKHTVTNPKTGNTSTNHSHPDEEKDKFKGGQKMKSPLQQNLYTCPECGAQFELPEYLAEHMEEHLSGDTGTGTPGSQYTGVKRNRGNFGKRIKSLFRRR